MFRINTMFAVALVCGVVAQVPSVDAQSYPWRSDAARTVQPNRTQTGVRSTAVQRNFSSPVSFARQQEGVESVLSDGQPSVSDVQQPAPAPTVVQGTAQPQATLPRATAPRVTTPGSVEPRMIGPVSPQNDVGQWVTGEPALSVQSNAGGASDYCQRDCRKRCCLGPERKLFGESCRGLEIGGWLSSGYYNRSTGLVNDRPGEFDLNQVWMYAQRQANRDSNGWGLGYRADFLYGLDAQNTQAFGNSPTGAPTGWDNGWDNGSFGWALPQLYMQVANNEWDVKIGKFISPFGYERIASTQNFFYSHSFTFFNTQPLTHSGVLAERNVGGGTTNLIGFSTGWDTGFENNSGGNLILGTRRRLGEFVKTSMTVSAGDTGFRDTGVFSSGVTEVQLTDSMRYVFQANVANLRDNQEFGIVQYLFRDVNECLGLGTRLEWWKSDRFFGGPTRSTYGFTMGANYRANSNLTIRPELRFDWGAAAVSPGEGIVAIDAVMTF
ncbi:MAG: outer membrane beta-barrel protein [Planctomycetota bacterium]